MKRKTKNLLFNIAVCAIVVFYLLPLYWLISTSLKSDVEIFRNPPTLFPREPLFSNYIAVLSVKSDTTNILRSLINSFIISTCTMVLSTVIALPCAYAIARFRIKFKSLLMFVFIIGQMLSPTVKLVPLFIIFKDMKLIDSLASVVISLCTFTIPFSVLIIRPFFVSIPNEIEESAKIDGCTRRMAFVRVIIPITYPGAIVAAIFSFLTGWGDLVYPLTFITNSAKRPLIAKIYTFIGEYQTIWNLLFTFAVISIIPVVIIFITAQKYIVGGLTLGSVKG